MLSYFYHVRIRIAVCTRRYNCFHISNDGLAQMTTSKLVSLEVMKDWPIITILHHVQNEILSPSNVNQKNHFLFLSATGEEHKSHHAVQNCTSAAKPRSPKRLHRSRCLQDWRMLCHRFEKLKAAKAIKSQKDFLSSHLSDPLSLKDRSVFSRWYKRFVSGELADVPVNAKRNSHPELTVVDEALKKYIDSKLIRVETGKPISISWKELQSVAQQSWLKNKDYFAVSEKSSFKASASYISNFLRRNSIKL